VPTQKSSPFLILFGLLFGSFGMLFVVTFSLWPAWQIWQARSWVAVRATMISSAVEERSGENNSTYKIIVRYSYRTADAPGVEVGDGPVRESDRYSFVGFSSSGRSSKQAVVDTLPPGAVVPAWVDPQHPDRAVLERGLTYEVILAGLFTSIFPMIGYGLALSGLLGMGAASPIGWRLRLGPAPVRWRQVVRWIVAALVISTWLAAATAALAWAAEGGFALVMVLLIAAALACVPIALWLAVGRRLRAWLGLQADLLVTGVPVPGGAMVLHWRLLGPVAGLSWVRLAVEGWEEHDGVGRNCFHRQELVDAVTDQQRQGGEVALMVPAHLPGPLVLAQRRIRWRIVVLGERPGRAPWRYEADLPLLSVPVLDIPAHAATPVPPRPSDRPLALHLFLPNGHTVPRFQPGAHVAGLAAFALPERPELVELRLRWFTADEGPEDGSVAARGRFAPERAEGVIAFDLRLPPAPPSLHGQVITIRWVLEVDVPPNGPVERLWIEVGPTGRMTPLPSVPGEG